MFCLFDLGYIEELRLALKFKEKQVLARVNEYINSTYSKHYAQGGIQATEFINASGYGEGFCLGNIIKYAQRFGKKGTTVAEKEKDLFKIIHYAVILLYELEQKNKNF